MFPYVSIDIETTGLDEDACDIIEFAAVLDDLFDPQPIQSLPVFHCYFDQPNYKGEPYALGMHSAIFKRIAERTAPYTYLSPTRLGNVFKQFLCKHGYVKDHDRVVITAAGKNFASFDLQFLKRKTDLLKHVQVRHRILDPSVLYLEQLDSVLPGTDTCKIRAGIVTATTHNAVDDAMDVVNLVRYKLGYMRTDIPT